MTVLLDLEWIENNGKHLTQLSAVRMDGNWNEIGRLDEIVRTPACCLKDKDHVAFGGFSTKLFENGIPEGECLVDLEQWLEPEDTIIVWANSNRRYLQELWIKHLKGKAPSVISAAKKARKIAAEDHFPVEDPYAMLVQYGGKPTYPEHRAANDVEVIRNLFRLMDMTLDRLSEPTPPPSQPPFSQSERNQKLIDNSQYNYLYLKHSKVFHRRNCAAVLQAKSHTEILGSVYYDTAACGHRPCKLCNPVPGLADAPITDADLVHEKKQVNRSNDYLKEVIPAKMLTGEVIQIRRGHILGWCQNIIHKGAVNKTIMKEHDCLGKNCPYLERNCQSPFWKNYELEQKAKEERKEKIRQEKLRKATEERELRMLTGSWQSYLEDMESDMHIVRLEKTAPSVFKVFYVSDNRFADGNRYPEFLETIKHLHPYHRLILRHIRDVDGHFVTREEYFSRQR